MQILSRTNKSLYSSRALIWCCYLLSTRYKYKTFFLCQIFGTESGESRESDKYRYMFHFYSEQEVKQRFEERPSPFILINCHKMVNCHEFLSKEESIESVDFLYTGKLLYSYTATFWCSYQLSTTRNKEATTFSELKFTGKKVEKVVKVTFESMWHNYIRSKTLKNNFNSAGVVFLSKNFQKRTIFTYVSLQEKVEKVSTFFGESIYSTHIADHFSVGFKSLPLLLTKLQFSLINQFN